MRPCELAFAATLIRNRSQRATGHGVASVLSKPLRPAAGAAKVIANQSLPAARMTRPLVEAGDYRRTCFLA